ncbi:GNAT family N-acetyltransferase [Cohnella caldifontis]|uniref:GNAT family N-acetyltransferase n=1 Tax=Cohnella caldifontis TaxID=3027471 RepID=UPI0023EC48C1|nr:GNAT family N-acetyltransferase [Cohnella sp. YIM B05605]
MDIRRLDLRDRELAEELWALQHAAYRQEADLIGVPSLPPLQDTVQSLQNCGETFYGCFGDDGELVGAVSTEAEDGGMTVCRMMVHPARFRQGIGSRLMSYVLSETPSVREWTVTAEIRNLPAIRLYERHGFLPGGTFQPAPDITMVRLSRKTE